MSFFSNSGDMFPVPAGSWVISDHLDQKYNIFKPPSMHLHPDLCLVSDLSTLEGWELKDYLNNPGECPQL